MESIDIHVTRDGFVYLGFVAIRLVNDIVPFYVIDVFVGGLVFLDTLKGERTHTEVIIDVIREV